MSTQALLQSDLSELRLVRRGKVRDLYEVGDELLLMVATDRISAFDCVLPTGIPDKGAVLTQLSAFWFDRTSSITPNHLMSADVTSYPAALRPDVEVLRGRSMLVRKTQPIPIECVARGYLAGSGWKEYRRDGAVCGIRLPSGLREADRLPEPIFTPATKAETGHDINISEHEAGALVGDALVRQLKALTLALYRAGAAHAESCGIIVADTKFEFGLLNDEGRHSVVLIDEALTPDSSRFWPSDAYQPGRTPPSFDKQFVRDYLESLAWNKQPPAPPLPDDVVARTREKYLEAFRRLTGRPLA